MSFWTIIRGINERRPEWTASQWLVLTESHNGFKRQAAVEALERLRHAAALPALLKRANDWVPEVRQAAQRALLSLLDEALLSDWIVALDDIVALERSGRADHQPMLAAIAGLLGRADLLPKVVAASAGARPAVRRHVAELQWTGAPNESARLEWLRAALTGSDVVLARRALGRLNDVPSPQQQATLAGAAGCSPFAPIRIEGVRRQLASPTAGTSSLARTLCFDDHATVRSLALSAARIHGEDPIVMADALKRLDNAALCGRSRATALHLLCAMEPAQAAARCQKALSSPSAAVRQVAFKRLLSAADGQTTDELLLRALADSSSKIQRLASDRIRHGAAVPPPLVVLQIASSHGGLPALRRAISVWRHSPTWARLHVLLLALQGPLPPNGPALLMDALDEWERDARRSFETASTPQRQVLKPTWQAVAATLPTALRQRVAMHLHDIGIQEQDSEEPHD